MRYRNKKQISLGLCSIVDLWLKRIKELEELNPEKQNSCLNLCRVSLKLKATAPSSGHHNTLAKIAIKVNAVTYNIKIILNWIIFCMVYFASPKTALLFSYN